MAIAKTLRCSHISPTIKTYPSLGIPIFHNSENNHLFIQRVNEFTRKIDGFDLVENDNEILIPTKNYRIAAPGDPILYGVINSETNSEVGTQIELSEKFKEILENPSAPNGLRVQVAEIVGDKITSKNLRRSIGSDAGVQSADISRTYHRSFAQTLFWQVLFDSAKNREVGELLLSKLPLIEVELTASGSVILNADSIDLSDFNDIDLKKIAASIEVELGINVPSNDDADDLHTSSITPLINGTEITESNVQLLVNEVMGADARVTSSSYRRSARLIKSLGFKDIEQVRELISNTNSRALAYYAWGTPQGSVTRLELSLLATMGENFIALHPRRNRNGFAENRRNMLERFKNNGVIIGKFDPTEN